MDSVAQQVPTISLNWLLLAFITAGIAQGKGQSGFGWFIASMFIGPFALVALVILFHKPNTPLPTQQVLPPTD
jgi:hypothetical protein